MSYRSGISQNDLVSTPTKLTYNQTVQVQDGIIHSLPINISAGTWVAFISNNFQLNSGEDCTVFLQYYGLTNTNSIPAPVTYNNFGAGLILPSGDKMINTSSYLFTLLSPTTINLFQQYNYDGNAPTVVQTVTFARLT